MDRNLFILLFLTGTAAMQPSPQTTQPESQTNLLDLLAMAQISNPQPPPEPQSPPTSPPATATTDQTGNQMPMIPVSPGSNPGTQYTRINPFGPTSSGPQTNTQLLQYTDPSTQAPAQTNTNTGTTQQQVQTVQPTTTGTAPMINQATQQTSGTNQAMPQQTSAPNTANQTPAQMLPPHMQPQQRTPTLNNFAPQLPNSMFPRMNNMAFPPMMNFQKPPVNTWMNMVNNAPLPQNNPYQGNTFAMPPPNLPQWAIPYNPWMNPIRPIQNAWGGPNQHMPGMHQMGQIPVMNQKGPMPGMHQMGQIPVMNQKGPMPGMNHMGQNPAMNPMGYMPGMNQMGPVPGMNQIGSMNGIPQTNSMPNRNSGGGQQQGLPSGAARPYSSGDQSNLLNSIMMIQAITGEPLELPMGGRGRGMGRLAGMSGFTGMSGLTGMNGLTGMSGLTGMNGLTGMSGLTGMNGLTGAGGAGANLFGGEGLGAALAMMQFAPELGMGTSSMGGNTGFGTSSTGFGSASTGFGSASTGFGSTTSPTSALGFGGQTPARNPMQELMSNPTALMMMNLMGIDLPDPPPAGRAGAPSGGFSMFGNPQTTPQNSWTMKTTFDPIASPTAPGTGTDLFSFGSTAGGGAGGGNFGSLFV